MHRVCKTSQGFCCMLGLLDEILPLLDKNRSFLHFFPLLAFFLGFFFHTKTPQCSFQPEHLSKMLSPAPACGSGEHGDAPQLPESMSWAQCSVFAASRISHLLLSASPNTPRHLLSMTLVSNGYLRHSYHEPHIAFGIRANRSHVLMNDG